MIRRQLLAVITLCNLAAVASSALGLNNEGLARSSAAVGAAPENERSEDQRTHAADEAKKTLHVEDGTPPVPSAVALQDAPQRSQRELGAETTSYQATNVVELQTALADATIDRIVLAAGTYEFNPSTAPWTSTCDFDSWLCVDRTVTIEAAEAGTVVLDAKGARRVFEIKGTGVQLTGLNITGGRVVGSSLYPSYGGGLTISGEANLNSCQISNNEAVYGGGLSVYSGGSATLEYCKISSNSAGTVATGATSGHGGGLHISGGGSATLEYCGISGNTGWNGGGMKIDGDAAIISCQIYDNEARNWGGGLLIGYGGNANLEYCDISGNTAENACCADGLSISTPFTSSSGNTYDGGHAVLLCCTVEDSIEGEYEEHDCPPSPPSAPPTPPPTPPPAPPPYPPPLWFCGPGTSGDPETGQCAIDCMPHRRRAQEAPPQPYTEDDERLGVEHWGAQHLAYLKAHVPDPAAKAEGLATFGKLQQAFGKTIGKQQQTIDELRRAFDEQQRANDMLLQQLSSEPHFRQPASA